MRIGHVVRGQLGVGALVASGVFVEQELLGSEAGILLLHCGLLEIAETLQGC